MEKACSNIPVPVSYSQLKHHLSCQIQFIYQSESDNPFLLMDTMALIGDNVIDVYTGAIPPDELAFQVMAILDQTGIKSREQLISWLGIKAYREILVCDDSRWVIRLSENMERFVHIHPGKKSKNSVRLRGTTLKTVIALCILEGKHGTEPDLMLLNRIRKQYLGLSPVKSLREGSGIVKWLFYFREKAVQKEDQS